MDIKDVKEIITLANELSIDKKELFEQIQNENDDFEVNNFRFIKESEAVEIAIGIYKCDEYMLGCFNDWFIADNCGIAYNVVQALQKAEAYQELGELMLDNGIEELIEEYCRLDGYGAVFSSYDGNNEEITLNGELYIYFRTN